MIVTKSFSVLSTKDITGNIHLIGVGALGSLIGLNLVRLGLSSKLTVYDFDIVEEKNLNNQAYLHNHIGLPKVIAFQDLASLIDPSEKVGILEGKVEKIHTAPGDIIIMAVDSYKGRMCILESIVNNNLVMVGGINSVGGNIEVVKGLDNVEKLYNEYSLIQDKGEYHPNDLTPCGSPISIYHRINVAASLACDLLIKHIREETEEVYTNIIFDFPNLIFIEK